MTTQTQQQPTVELLYAYWQDCQKNYGKFHPLTARARERYHQLLKIKGK